MLKKTMEGKVKVFYYPGEVSKKSKVFYNEHMKFNRDVSVLALQVFQKEIERRLKVIDVMAATGVRGIRYSKEVKGIDKVILNDLNPSAIKLMKKNVALNKVKNAEIYKKDANVLLSELKYLIDFVDIDPFGSPIQYLDAGARAVSNKGFLGITATDTGPLAGAYPRTCARRYYSIPLKSDISKEIGIRILILAIARECSKYDKGFIPVLSFEKRHYFRIFGKIKKTKTAAEEGLNNSGYVLYCKKCGFRELSKEKRDKCTCKSNLENAGPLWIGNIFEKKFCSKMHKKAEDEKVKKFLGIVKEEAKINYLFYDLHYLASLWRKEVPKTQELIKKLKKNGFEASGTHFSGSGIRTNANIKQLKKVF